jgi:hypothetical protein
MMLPPARAFTIEKCGLPGVPYPIQPVSLQDHHRPGGLDVELHGGRRGSDADPSCVVHVDRVERVGGVRVGRPGPVRQF